MDTKTHGHICTVELHFEKSQESIWIASESRILPEIGVGGVSPGSHSALVSALISPVVSGEEDAPGGHDGVAPPPHHGDAGPGHWV